MRTHLKRLGSETAVYGISTIVGRFLNFLLVPFYTNVLTPGDYGIVTYAYSLIAFVNVIYSYGMESAYFKYSSTLEIGNAKENFSTPFTSILITTAILSAATLGTSRFIADAMFLPEDYYAIVGYAVGMLAFDALALIPFASLRMERKARLFATIKVVNIVINVALNVILLIVLQMGVVGIFISGFVASAVTIVMLLPTVLRQCTIQINGQLLRALFPYALPFVPAGLATMAVQVIDRPILRALTDDTTVGIYQANYRLGIFMMLVVQMFDYAWRPFYFAMAKEPNAKAIFARVMTYLILLMSVIFMVLTFFLTDIVKISFFGRHLIHPNYWGGLNIVPVVLASYLFLGIGAALSAGIYIEKKTKYSPFITFLGAFVNVAALYLLIPMAGMLGAAWATLLAYAVMALALYVVVQRVYPINYEFGRIGKISASLAVVMVFYYVLPIEVMGVAGIFVSMGLCMFFLLLMYVMKFFEANELATLTSFFSLRSPASDERSDTIDSL